jgi:succinate-semialdehyde dehydrogenase / glutarate-semialdehyde dehydrogenase
MASPGVDVKLFEKLVKLVSFGPLSHARIEVRAPFTGNLLGTIPVATDADVAHAIELARTAQKSWAALSFRHRAAVLLRFHDLLLNRQEETLDLIQLESGKSRAHAFEEILDTAIVARYYARRAGKFLRARRRKGALPLLTRTLELRVPLGVVGFLTPWNFPLTLGMTDAIAALLAGNAAIVKPDPQASFTALWAANLLREAGLPENVLCIVTGEGQVAGQALVDHADYIMFTGSERVGRMIAAKAGERLIGCALELGGKNALLVLEDADLDKAADGASRACFAGAGQVCISTERIYVQQSVFPAFLEKFTSRIRALKLAAALDYSVNVGSLTTAAQLQKIESHIADAIAKGATIVVGGRRRPDLGPLFFEPTLLTGVRQGMKLFDEETFGPVVSIYAVAGEKDAIAQANASQYGLSASIWTRDTAKGARLARQVEAGSVNINEGYSAAWGSIDSPIGGMKASGLHPRHGAEGIRKFTASQTIAVQHLMPIAPAYGMSQEFFARWMTRLLKILRWTPWLG